MVLSCPDAILHLVHVVCLFQTLCLQGCILSSNWIVLGGWNASYLLGCIAWLVTGNVYVNGSRTGSLQPCMDLDCIECIPSVLKAGFFLLVTCTCLDNTQSCVWVTGTGVSCMLVFINIEKDTPVHSVIEYLLNAYSPNTNYSARDLVSKNLLNSVNIL